MVEVYVPNDYCSKSFWGSNFQSNENDILNTASSCQQPFSVYHLTQPHLRRLKNDHLGASPLCRASVSKSMQLLRKVLQPAINHDILKVFEKYILVFREAAENACENIQKEPFSTNPNSLNVDIMVAETCQEALSHAKSIFSSKEAKDELKSKGFDTAKATGSANIPTHLLHNGKRRVASPDFPWRENNGVEFASGRNSGVARRSIPSSTKTPPLYRTPRLKDDNDIAAQRRSLSPVPKKRFKNSTPVVAPRRYGSPHRNTKDTIRKKIETQWDPARLTTNTEFVMGTKANRALGLGATRGRIYMKHPDLFKYAGDHEDKKWMVKNNCMAATGGKNTFLMMAEDVMHLYDTEYKESPGTMPEELQFFKLPEFVLAKMRSAMVNEKKLRLRQLTEPSVPDATSSREHSDSQHTTKSSVQRTVRQAAQVATAVINATSESLDDPPEMMSLPTSVVAVQAQSESSHLDSDSDMDDVI